MRRALLLASCLLGAVACGAGYDNSELEILTRYRALTMCSCVFVTGRDEEFCDRFSTQSPPVATVTVDHDARVVDAQSLLLYSARARFVSDRLGCGYER